MKKIYPLIILLLLVTAAKSQYVQKVTSINYYGYNGLNPSNLTVFNGKLYFFGTDDLHYVDKLMFTANGSEAGVTVVKQIDTMKQYPTLRHLTLMNNLLIFDNYHQLWKSDGTTDGTSSIASINTSSTNYVVLNNKVYFAADNSNSNPMQDQLWQTDGTANGTSLVKTINPAGAAFIINMFVSGGKIYFGANDGINQNQLWVSDGTAAGTMMLKKLNPTGDSYPSNFITFNGKVYFSGDDGVNGAQLWATDGTTAGTQEITHINAPGTIGLQPSTFIVFNSRLFFMGIDTGAYYQLWATNGTTAGTVKVKTDNTQRNGYSGFMPTSMAVHNNMLYLAGYDSLTQVDQLWKSDGTTAGTLKITNFRLGLFPDKLFSFQNRLIFTGYDSLTEEQQLFATDGTAAGTVCPTPPDTWGQYPFYPWEAWVPFNNALYYKAAYSYFADYQLCRYTETPAGIARLTAGNLKVYPNPTKDLVHIMLPAANSNSRIEVYNCTGLLIHKENAANDGNILDLSNFATGLYILNVISDNRTIASQKIIKE
jgi:ELWxxDGT repeat protein